MIVGRPAVYLRAITAEDFPLLRRVYASTRSDIEAVEWDAAQKDAFLNMQFDAQHVYYQAQFPNANYQIVEHDGQAVGRLYVDRRPDVIHILDITLLPEARGLGLGSLLLQELINEADATNRDLSLYVERENTARALYQRLNFRQVEEQGIYILMRRRQGTPAST
jgi:ribosomal protein S18 acetylase RimI-like enzyme